MTYVWCLQICVIPLGAPSKNERWKNGTWIQRYRYEIGNRIDNWPALIFWISVVITRTIRNDYVLYMDIYNRASIIAIFNLLTPELNPSGQSCLTRFFLLGILFFKGLTARRVYKSFGVKGINNPLSLRPQLVPHSIIYRTCRQWPTKHTALYTPFYFMRWLLLVSAIIMPSSGSS
jgi:hypothetical protein